MRGEFYKQRAQTQYQALFPVRQQKLEAEQAKSLASFGKAAERDGKRRGLAHQLQDLALQDSEEQTERRFAPSLSARNYLSIRQGTQQKHTDEKSAKSRQGLAKQRGEPAQSPTLRSHGQCSEYSVDFFAKSLDASKCYNKASDLVRIEN